jgi:murein DD-endopeptidase MepM/ murein hydrolase activator NlpD
MNLKGWKKEAQVLCCALVVIAGLIVLFWPKTEQQSILVSGEVLEWVDFNVPLQALQKAGQADIDTYGEVNHVDWIEALSCLAVEYGGDWSQYKGKDLDRILEQLKKGETPSAHGQKYYDYYDTAYDAVLSEFIGLYQTEQSDENGKGNIVTQYGVKVFSPIAGGYGYSHYDDFGNRRSYGFQRNHLGNDLMGSIGTPIVAVESGTIEAMSWNQYGGWRIGIRSFDKKRYYYYAHLKSGHPYVSSLSEGDTVMAGDVIGYLGMTGYSTVEDTNGMSKPHLHFGMQLIFDESQKECDNEIWIDVYEIVNFLQKHRSAVQWNEQTEEFERIYPFDDLTLVE